MLLLISIEERYLTILFYMKKDLEVITTVSIVVPFYNAAASLEIAIKSVVDQTFDDWELILVNDGSLDSSYKIAKKWTEKDKRIKLLVQQNKGRSSARNLGIQNATGEWIAFLDADDLVLQNGLEVLVSAIQENTDLICGGFLDQKAVLSDMKIHHWQATELMRMIADSSAEVAIDRSLTNFDELFERTVWGKLYRKSIIDLWDVKFLQGLKYGEDALFNIAFLRRSTTVTTINFPVYHYNRSSEGTTRQYPPGEAKALLSFAEQCETFFAQYLNDKMLSEQEVGRFVSNEIFKVVGRAARYARNLKSAAKELEEVILCNSFLRKSLKYFTRPTFIGRVVNCPVMACVRGGHIIIAIYLERLLIKIGG